MTAAGKAEHLGTHSRDGKKKRVVPLEPETPSPTKPSTTTTTTKDSTTNNRRELFKNSKFNDNLNSTIDVITEDFQTLTANISSLIKSDSSKSLLNESGQQEISVEAQIHCQAQQTTPSTTMDDATTGSSPALVQQN